MRFFLVLLAQSFFQAEPLMDPAPWGKITYKLTTEPIDVVIPCSPKDLDTLELCIEGVKEYAANIRRIIVVSKERLTDSAEWFSEDLFPFSPETIVEEVYGGSRFAGRAYLNSPRTRIGWIFQQFLKFYAPFVIPDISPNVLILDSDVILLQPMHFMTPQGNPLFTPALEYTREYFEHAAKLLPGFHRVHRAYSGIAHHMLFQRPILEDFFALIEQFHHVEPWKAISRCISPITLYRSSLSEYEIYFNFVLLRSNQGSIRHLRWANIGAFINHAYYRRQQLTYVASHRWLCELEQQLGGGPIVNLFN